MKNRFIITNDEKSRILSLHESVKPQHGTSVYNNSLLMESKEKEKKELKKVLDLDDEGKVNKFLDTLQKYGDKLSKMSPEQVYNELKGKMDKLKKLKLNEQVIDPFGGVLDGGGGVGGGGFSVSRGGRTGPGTAAGGGVNRGSARGPHGTQITPSSGHATFVVVGPLVGLLSLGKIYEWAEENGKIEQVENYLKDLSETISNASGNAWDKLTNLFK